MPFDLPLPAALADQGWKAKIRDRDRVETPHVTVLSKTRSWRASLCDLESLDRTPPPRDVPHEILAAIHAGLDELREAWDARYRTNPV